MGDNLMILKQGLLMVGLMLASFSPEMWVMYKNPNGKLSYCILGIISKVVILYFFSSILAGSFFGAASAGGLEDVNL